MHWNRFLLLLSMLRKYDVFQTEEIESLLRIVPGLRISILGDFGSFTLQKQSGKRRQSTVQKEAIWKTFLVQGCHLFLFLTRNLPRASYNLLCDQKPGNPARQHSESQRDENDCAHFSSKISPSSVRFFFRQKESSESASQFL